MKITVSVVGPSMGARRTRARSRRIPRRPVLRCRRRNFRATPERRAGYCAVAPGKGTISAVNAPGRGLKKLNLPDDVLIRREREPTPPAVFTLAHVGALAAFRPATGLWRRQVMARALASGTGVAWRSRLTSWRRFLQGTVLSSPSRRASVAAFQGLCRRWCLGHRAYRSLTRRRGNPADAIDRRQCLPRDLAGKRTARRATAAPPTATGSARRFVG